jgi:hypothetical protein
MVTTLCFQGILSLEARPFNHPEPRSSGTSGPFSRTPHGSQTGAGFDVLGPRPVRDWRNGIRNTARGLVSRSPFAPDAMIKPRSRRFRAALGRRASGRIPNGLDRDCRHHGVAARCSAASAGQASIDTGAADRISTTSAVSHSEDSEGRQDVRYWAMVWGMEPWHNRYVWF